MKNTIKLEGRFDYGREHEKDVAIRTKSKVVDIKPSFGYIKDDITYCLGNVPKEFKGLYIKGTIIDAIYPKLDGSYNKFIIIKSNKYDVISTGGIKYEAKKYLIEILSTISGILYSEPFGTKNYSQLVPIIKKFGSIDNFNLHYTGFFEYNKQNILDGGKKVLESTDHLSFIDGDITTDQLEIFPIVTNGWTPKSNEVIKRYPKLADIELKSINRIKFIVRKKI